MYTFSEWCEEVPDLPLEDGTSKIFLNMTSKNGRPELVSLLQYMKNTTLNNPGITVKDERILDLDRIVVEVKESEEWEAVKMNILEIGLARGEELGRIKSLVSSVEALMKNCNMDLQHACQGVDVTVEEYENAKEQIAVWEK